MIIDIIIGVSVISILGLAVKSLIKNKKKGSGCCSGCSGCSAAKGCHHQ